MRCPKSPPRADYLLNLPVAKLKASIVFWMYWLFTPEPSDLRFNFAHAVPPSWREVLKTIFWVGMSIGTGVLLARICS